MLWVGLTGGIASGKSTVARLLQQEGAEIIDADRIAHRLIRKGGAAYSEVLSAFGKGILDGLREISRKRLGELIFSSPEARHKLNQILHPLVFERALAEKARVIRKNPEKVIVFELPLLFEVKADLDFDSTLLAYVDRKMQIERVIRRDGFSREDALLRIQAQMPLEDKVPLSDEVIETGRPVSEVQKQVRRIYLEWVLKSKRTT